MVFCSILLQTLDSAVFVKLQLDFFGTSVDTQQWAQPITAGVHGVSSKKCQLEVVK